MQKVQVTKDRIIIDDTIVLKRTKKALQDIVMNFWLDYSDQFSEYFDKRMTYKKKVVQAKYRLDSFKHTCKRCGFIWRSKTENPVACKKCKNPNWNRDEIMHNHHCKKCNREWESKTESPVSCKFCRNRNWNK